MIHPTAHVSPLAIIGSKVTIGPFSIIHDNVVIGDEAVIDSYCEIGCPAMIARGLPLVIGKQARIRSHSVFYEGSTFGDKLVTGHRVTVREFTNAGANFQIGTLTDIQGHCVIGDYVRTHSNVHIGQQSKIGNFVWLFPYVVLTNDPHPPSAVLLGCEIEDYASVATMSVILPGVKIGAHSLVAAHSCVGRDVDPHTVVAGTPAKYICMTDKIMRRDGSGKSAYPWNTHFNRGYPPEIVDMWERGISEIPQATGSSK